MEPQIAVIDFGSQYTQLIVRRLRELGYFSKLYQPEALRETGAPKGVILSGGPSSVLEEGAPDIDLDYLRELGVPVLGVCYGMQLLNKKLGGVVVPGEGSREYGQAGLFPVDGAALFEGVAAGSQVWMSHSDTCADLPDGAQVIARNQHGIPVSIRWDEQFTGIQFHPEVTHSHEGMQILKNYLAMLDDKPRFKIDSFKDLLIAQIREEVGEREVVCGVSGGVDSTVLALSLIHISEPTRQDTRSRMPSSA